MSEQRSIVKDDVIGWLSRLKALCLIQVYLQADEHRLLERCMPLCSHVLLNTVNTYRASAPSYNTPRRDRTRRCYLFTVEQLREHLYPTPDAVGAGRREDYFPEGAPPPPVPDTLPLVHRALLIGSHLEAQGAELEHLAAVFQSARRVAQSEEELETVRAQGAARL